MSINDYLNNDWTKLTKMMLSLNISESEQVDVFSLLETIKIDIIEQYVRIKKLEKINSNTKKLTVILKNNNYEKC